MLIAVTTRDGRNLCSRFDALTHVYGELTFNLVYIFKKGHDTKWFCLFHASYQIKLFALFLVEVVSRKKFCNIGSVLCLALSLFFLFWSRS